MFNPRSHESIESDYDNDGIIINQPVSFQGYEIPAGARVSDKEQLCNVFRELSDLFLYIVRRDGLQHNKIEPSFNMPILHYPPKKLYLDGGADTYISDMATISSCLQLGSGTMIARDFAGNRRKV